MKILVSIAVGAVLLALSVPASPALAQQKTAKACADEWKANKADNQAKGITEKAYVAQCRAGTASPQTSPAPTAPAGATAAPPAAPKSAPTAAATPSGANQFSSEAQAKARCSGDTVVWVNLKSNIYHFAGTKDYGNTKSGAYMCEKDATGQGKRAAKNEKHP